MNRAQLSFAVFGLLIVCSLIAASLGAIAVELMLDGDADPEEFAADGNDDLIEDLREEVARNPEDAESMGLLASLLARESNLDEAIGWYERALELDPTNTAIRLSFAQALKDGGKRADAELQFRRVLEAEPNNFEAHYYFAELYRLWDPPRIDEAVAHYRRVIEIAPTAYLAELSAQQLALLGVATPVAAATPRGTPPATPVSAATEEAR